MSLLSSKKCNESKTLGQGMFVSCGEREWDEHSPIWLCEKCYAKKIRKIVIFITFIIFLISAAVIFYYNYILSGPVKPKNLKVKFTVSSVNGDVSSGMGYYIRKFERREGK